MADPTLSSGTASPKRIFGTDVWIGHVIECLAQIPTGSVNCVVTSPPYWGLRKYGVEPQIWGGSKECEHAWGDAEPGSNRGGSGTPTDKNNRGEEYGRASERGTFCQLCGAWRGELGLEPSPQLYIEHMLMVFAEIWRVLAKDGTCWLNLGDSYAQDQKWGGQSGNKNYTSAAGGISREKKTTGLKPKSLIGMPWRVALALQEQGWILRSAIIWVKPNPMPESVTDRPTRSYEEIFLLVKSPKYWYDADAIAEPVTDSTIARISQPDIELQEGSTRANGGGKTNGNMKAVVKKAHLPGPNSHVHVARNLGGDPQQRTASTMSDAVLGLSQTRNARDVWTIATAPYAEAHFATFPPEIPRRCISAGCPPGGTVLDPFVGSGTTLAEAVRLGRKAIGIDLGPQNLPLIEKRLRAITPPLPMEVPA